MIRTLNAVVGLVKPVAMQALLARERLESGVAYNPLFDEVARDLYAVYRRLRDTPTDLRSAVSLRTWPFVRLPSSIALDDARSMILSPLAGSELQTDYSRPGAGRPTRLPPRRPASR